MVTRSLDNVLKLCSIQRKFLLMLARVSELYHIIRVDSLKQQQGRYSLILIIKTKKEVLNNSLNYKSFLVTKNIKRIEFSHLYNTGAFFIKILLGHCFQIKL